MITAKFAYPQNGHDHDVWAAGELLEPNGIYEVVGGEIHTYYSYVYLKGFDVPFNTVQFEFFKDNQPIDIIKEKYHAWNQYILTPDKAPVIPQEMPKKRSILHFFRKD